MVIALLGEPYVKKYRGIYRKFPYAPKEKKALELWTECLYLTQGFPVEYSLEVFVKLYNLRFLLKSEKIPADLILADRNIDITNIKTKLLGYDITNDNKWGTNEFKLLDNAFAADSIAEYLNEHMDDFEKEGNYRRISIECVV